MGKFRNPRFVSFSDKVGLKQLLADTRPISDEAKTKNAEEFGELKKIIFIYQKNILALIDYKLSKKIA